jgi:signal transduction histidine kinase
MTLRLGLPVYARAVTALYAWLRDHPRLVDGVLAFVVLVFGGAQGAALGRWVLIPVAFGLAVPVVVRRQHPVGAFIAGIAFGAVQVALDTRPSSGDLAILILLYTLAAYRPRRESVIGLAITLVGSTVAVSRWSPTRLGFPEGLLITLVFFAGPALLAWTLGDSMRWRRAFYAALEDRAARLERERDAQAQIAAAAERARIARELHDVVAHNVSVMVVQADGASYALGSDPERARQALAAIAATGRQALDEMRRLLGVLRRDGAGNGLAPMPGLEELAQLLEQARAAGLPVSYSVAGVPRLVPSGAALAAYRIVQESLTNTRKHAGPAASAAVTLRYCEDALMLTITDDGRGAAAVTDGAGHGLTGMRERVSVYGGTLTAGPRAGGGYEVTAVLPLTSSHLPAAGALAPVPAPGGAQ